MGQGMGDIKLEDLFADLGVTVLVEALPANLCAFSSITVDSRNARPGCLFVALKGDKLDGHHFLAEAAERGAAAVLCNVGAVPSEMRALLTEKQLLIATVPDTAETLPELAARFYDYPADKLRMVGITGTNGKTTVAYLTEHVLLSADRAVGVIGTINNRYQLPGKEAVIFPTHLTTPAPLELQRILREMVDAGVEDVVMEVSSHALVQNRVGTISFSVAAFTNLSRDHLDYHQDMEAYFEAKSRLFQHYLLKGGVAVLPENNDYLDSAAGDEAVIYHWGRNSSAEIQLQRCDLGLDATEMECQVFSQNFHIKTTLVGEYNLENMLVAWGICIALGVDAGFTGFALSRAKSAPGRVERVSVNAYWTRENPVVLVDYAHTPDALEKVLSTAAALPHCNLCVVFGCGGDRDGGKRAVMGEVAARLADVTIVTDDNPRTERPEDIIAEILLGVQKTDCPVFEKEWLHERKENEKGCVVFRNRALAISHAVRSMGDEDIVVIAGKGHEPYQITAEGRQFFDDRWQAEHALFSWSPELIAEATGGAPHGTEHCSLSDIVIDSRVENPEGIFVALRGENHDGHDFAVNAVAAGNRCLVVEHIIENLPAELSQIVVSDSLSALGDLATYRRSCVEQYLLNVGREFLVIGITGSCGKTTVKEMVAAIFRRQYPEGEQYPSAAILKTAGNFNNLIGLPLTLLPIGVEQRVAILEMGMNAPGEIARLADISMPHIRSITNIHGAHLEGLGSIDGVADAKGELFASARERDTLIVNLDDKRVVAKAADYSQRSVGFSLHRQKGATLWAEDVVMDVSGCCNFVLCQEGARRLVRLAVAGEHNVRNSLCAAAISLAADTSFENIVAGLEDFSAIDKRMEICFAKAGCTLINDCYNANPASMEAALEVFAALGKGTKMAVLGDMLELGAAGKEAHYRVGKRVAELGVDQLVVLGSFAKDVEAGALAAGLAEEAITIFTEKKSLISWLTAEVKKLTSPEDILLVKGSRGLALESVVQELL